MKPRRERIWPKRRPVAWRKVLPARWRRPAELESRRPDHLGDWDPETGFCRHPSCNPPEAEQGAAPPPGEGEGAAGG